VTRLKWKLDSVLLEIVAILAQDRCTVCAERTIGSEIIFDAPVELLGDVGPVDSHFGLSRLLHYLRETSYRLGNHFGHT
jgi:hypothetical protein